MGKHCIYCGAALPENATFCTHCAKSQIEKIPLTAPKPVRRHGTGRLAFLLASMALAAGLFCLRNLPMRTAYTELPAEYLPAAEAPEAAPPETETAQPLPQPVTRQGTRAGQTAQYVRGIDGYLEYTEYSPNWKWAYHLVSGDGANGQLDRYDESGTLISSEQVENAEELAAERLRQWD